MRLLAFDTCSTACSAAVVETRLDASGNAIKSNDCKVLSEAFEFMDRGHADCLLPMVHDVMRRAKLSFRDLDAIATAYGPGSFTGVRIAVACARALSLSGELPVFGFSSLSLIAAKARHLMGQTRDGCLIAATMDARRDEIYVQLFDNPARLPISAPQVLSPSDACRLPSQPIICVGTGASMMASAAAEQGLTVDACHIDLLPDAAFSSCLHMKRLDPLKPLYLRPPDAKPQIGKSIAAV